MISHPSAGYPAGAVDRQATRRSFQRIPRGTAKALATTLVTTTLIVVETRVSITRLTPPSDLGLYDRYLLSWCPALTNLANQ